MAIKNLVFSGGHFKGISYIGVLKALEELNIKKNLKTILGVSSGSLFTLPFVLGLSSHQIETILNSLSLEQIYNINIESILNISCDYGIDNGFKISNLLKIIIRQILNNENATFKDLHEFNPDLKFIVGAANISTKEYEYFSYETTPDMPLYLAVRISISIPIYFKSICYNDNHYMDGAFINNYPIDYFKDEMDVSYGIIFNTSVKKTTINSLTNYIYNVTSCVMGIMQNYLKEKYKKNTIILDIDYDISTLKFDSDTKQNLIQLGYDEFMKNYSNLFGKIETESIETKESVNIDEMIESIKDEINSNDS